VVHQGLQEVWEQVGLAVHQELLVHQEVWELAVVRVV